MCSDRPCGSNGKSCEDLESAETDGRQFVCTCNRGFMGTECDEIDHCAFQECSGHGTCSNAGNTFSCECDTGWEEADCSADIDECSRDSPCTRENAERDCENLAGSYDCHC